MFPSAVWPTCPGTGKNVGGASDGLTLHLPMSLKCRAQSWPFFLQTISFFLPPDFLSNGLTLIIPAALNPYGGNCTINKIQI